MKSIYDMMGRCTLPAPRDSAPAEHVEQFFQVSLHHTVGMGMGWGWGGMGMGWRWVGWGVM